MNFIESNHDYNCIPNFKFTDIQVESIEFALSRLNCILGLKPGTGKTITSLRIAYQILKMTRRTVCFIVCPKEANSAFKKEFETRLKIDYSIVTTEEKVIRKTGRFLIFNYSNIQKMGPYLEKVVNAGWKPILIADEVHLMGSETSNMSKVLRSYRSYFACVIGLTGTPVLNALEGVWRIVDFVRPGFLGTYNAFRYRYIKYRRKKLRVGGRVRNIEEVVGYERLDELKTRLEEVIISRGVDYNVNFIYRSTVLSDEEKKNYEVAAKGVFDSEDEQAFSARLHNLQRIADGSHHLLDSSVTYAKGKLLITVLAEIISRGEGVLIYTEYEDTYIALGGLIKKYRGLIRYNRLSFITGKTPYKERLIVERTLSPKDIVILTKAGSKSINLQAVNNVVFYNVPFSVGDFLQCCGRITRVDTKYSQQNMYILEVEGTIDSYKRILLQAHADVIRKLFGKDSNLPYTRDTEEEFIQKYRQYLKNKLLWCRF